MHRTPLLALAGVIAWATIAAGTQPAALRAHVQDERFGIVTSIRGLPLGVRDGLQTLFGSPTLDIAEPDGVFEALFVDGGFVFFAAAHDKSAAQSVMACGARKSTKR